MSWRMDSTAGAAIWDTQPMTTDDLALRDEEIQWLMRRQRPWKLVNGRIAASGDPTALLGSYSGLMAYPPQGGAAPSVAVTSTSTPGVALWTSSLYSPIPNNGILGGQTFKCISVGTVQTSTTSMTSTLVPLISAATSGSAPSVTTKALGPSGTLTLAATALTCLYHTECEIVIQEGGAAGSAYGIGKMHFTTAAAPATSAQVSQGMYGGTQATSIDFTGATANLPGGFCLSTFASASTVTWVPQIIIFIGW